MTSTTVITTEHAPQAIGAYSQARRVGNTVYISGQIPLMPGSMALLQGDVEAKFRLVFDNLTAIAQAAGGQLADIVKMTVYLTDLGHYALLNAVMEDYFSAPFPARAVVQVAGLPKGVPIEVEGILQNPEVRGQKTEGRSVVDDAEDG